MKRCLIFILLFLIYACSQVNIQKSDKIKNKETDKVQEEILKNQKIKMNDVPLDEYVYLFFDRYVKNDKVKKVVKNNNPVKLSPADIDPKNYRVIIDWQVENDRFIKMENRANGKIYVIKDGDTTGEIVLLERHLRYYIFLIGGNTRLRIER